MKEMKRERIKEKQKLELQRMKLSMAYKNKLYKQDEWKSTCPQKSQKFGY